MRFSIRRAGVALVTAAGLFGAVACGTDTEGQSPSATSTNSVTSQAPAAPAVELPRECAKPKDLAQRTCEGQEVDATGTKCADEAPYNGIIAMARDILAWQQLPPEFPVSGKFRYRQAHPAVCPGVVWVGTDDTVAKNGDPNVSFDLAAVITHNGVERDSKLQPSTDGAPETELYTVGMQADTSIEVYDLRDTLKLCIIMRATGERFCAPERKIVP